jgi:4-coumarate--CoA ligase
VSLLGLPKGVQLTHSNLMMAFKGFGRSRKLVELVYNEPLRSVIIAPWFHVLGFLGMFLLSCSENCQAIFLAKFDGEAFLRCIEKYRANCAMVVPPIMVFLAKTPLFDKYDLSSLKVIKFSNIKMARDENPIRLGFRL